jgi:hypothetical protein
VHQTVITWLMHDQSQWEAQAIVGLAAADGTLFAPGWKTLFAYSQ